MFRRMVLFLTFILLIVTMSINAEPNLVELTETERNWLNENSPILYAPDLDFAPFEYVDEELQYSGINFDYLNLIEEQLDIEFEIKVVGSWDETLEALKEKKVDFITATVVESRKESMFFTNQFAEIPSGIIVRNDYEGLLDASMLKGMRVSTVKGWAWNEIIESDYPGAKLVEYPSIIDAINAVAFGEVDATVQDLAVATYHIETNLITNLKYGGKYDHLLDLHFAVRNDAPILRDILNKAIAAIPESQRREVYKEWIRIKEPSFFVTDEFRNFLFFLLFTVTLILIWTFSLRLEVKKRTSELENSLIYLKETQRQLVEQEKMASLGGVAAGLFHEVKTPLGSSLTTITFMDKELDLIKKRFEDQKISKKELAEYFDEYKESISILDRNINSAISLVQNFKTMAVDQITDTKTHFDFCDYISKVNSAMKFECKKKNASIRFECSNDIYVNSYPGVFSQIFTNLISNSLVHGFIDNKKGNITIEIKEENSKLVIKYSDDGVGMAPAHVEKVFDLFFTTKKNKGSSGIGMNIVYSLVKQRLGGKVSCTSELGKGVEFNIEIPMENLK